MMPRTLHDGVRRDDGSVIYGWPWKDWQIQNAYEEKFGTVQASTLYALAVVGVCTINNYTDVYITDVYFFVRENRN
jgi:hypothetical protein